MTRGMKVAGGDRLGKTILFAKNQAHAEFIAERFDANYPHYKGEFARVITFKTEYAQSLIDDFSKKDKAPHIAISVDMLDTGIDVPEVVNLVFFKLVRSKTKFWQMVGRGTRLCPDLFGPGRGQAVLLHLRLLPEPRVLQPEPGDDRRARLGESLGKRLFTTRLELIGELDQQVAGPTVGRPRERAADRTASRRPKREVRHGRAATAARRSRGDEPRQLRRPAAAAARREVREARGLDRALDRGPCSELGARSRRACRRARSRGRGGQAVRPAHAQLQLARLRAEPGFERLRDQVQGDRRSAGGEVGHSDGPRSRCR